MAIIDPTLVAEIGGVVSALTQVIKGRPFLKKVDGQVIAGVVGVVTGTAWFLISQGSSLVNVFEGVANGILAGTGASGLFNLQKVLPMPNILPTRSETDLGKKIGESPPFTEKEEAVVETATKIETEGVSPAGRVTVANEATVGTVG